MHAFPDINAGLSNKSSCLAGALSVTKPITIFSKHLLTLKSDLDAEQAGLFKKGLVIFSKKSFIELVGREEPDNGNINVLSKEVSL